MPRSSEKNLMNIWKKIKQKNKKTNENTSPSSSSYSTARNTHRQQNQSSKNGLFVNDVDYNSDGTKSENEEDKFPDTITSNNGIPNTIYDQANNIAYNNTKSDNFIDENIHMNEILTFGHVAEETLPMNVSSSNFPKQSSDDEMELPSNIRIMIINTVRNIIFRRIKFLTNEKLSIESSIFKTLYDTTGFQNRIEQSAKYEVLRSLVQRQMNSKRNYCTDQIMNKARGKFVNFWL